jgi:hypothetical protein
VAATVWPFDRVYQHLLLTARELLLPKKPIDYQPQAPPADSLAFIILSRARMPGVMQRTKNPPDSLTCKYFYERCPINFEKKHVHSNFDVMPIKYKFCAMADEYTANYGFNLSTPLTFTGAAGMDYIIFLNDSDSDVWRKTLTYPLMINFDMAELKINQ